jgi:Cu(I)/Ag(I) efflux system membrane fusion protein
MHRTLRLLLTLLAVLVLGAGTFYLGRRSAPPASIHAGGAAAIRYTCPMHPDFTQDRPGTCPICGMKLVPLQAEAAVTPVPGRATVTLPPDRLQALGVRTQAIEEGPLRREIRTVGRIAVDERRLHQVHAKYEGYVERLHADYTGALVKKGEPLLDVYSPDLLAAQQEYLLAYRSAAQLRGSGLPGASEQAMALLDASRRRLLLWDFQAEAIDRLERTGEAERAVAFPSPVDGFLVEKKTSPGSRVMPADPLFVIADLSRVWVLADVYESDLALVRVGMAGAIRMTYFPGRNWSGTVAWLAPTVDASTRTVKVRLEVENTDLELRPEMFAEVTLTEDMGVGPVLPESAVIDAGDRQIVFLERGEGRFEPREVRLGPKVTGGFQVLSGVAAGDRVVTSANFLLDSESSLKASLAASAPHTGH